MSLSDFTFKSKYSNGLIRPQPTKNKKCVDLDNLINQIRGAKVRRRTGQNSSIEEGKVDNEFFISLGTNPTSIKTQSPPLIKKRLLRTWQPSDPATSLQKLFPNEMSGFLKFQVENVPEENIPPIIDRRCSRSIYIDETVKLTVLQENKHKQMKRSTKGRKKRKKIKADCSSMPHVFSRVSPQQMKEILQRRNERIEHAKLKRNNIHNMKILKLEESIERKEQRRLNNNKKKEIEARQMKLIRIIILASTMQRWLKQAPAVLDNFRRERSLEEAAIKIQTMWRRDLFKRKAFEAKVIKKKMKNCGWRIQLYARCSRRRLYARVIRSFLLDMRKNHPLCLVIFMFRQRVLKAQKELRNFIDCKHARIEALEEKWVRLEKEVIALEEFKNKRRRRKNALTDISRRKILSKNLVGAMFCEERPGSASKRKEAISRTHFTHVCHFFLEDSRRLHIETASAPPKKFLHEEDIQKATLADVKKLLAGSDINEIVHYQDKRFQPLFALYSKNEELRKKIEDFRQNEETFILKIKERLDIQRDQHKANRYAANLLTSPKKMSDQNCPEIEYIELANKLRIPSQTLTETRDLFNLIDGDSKGYLCRFDIQHIFDQIGFCKASNGDKFDFLRATHNELNIEFEDFINILQKEINRTLPHSRELIIRAFNFFASEEGSTPEGTIDQKVFVETLQKYGADKWDRTEAADALRTFSRFAGIHPKFCGKESRRVGNINYKEVVELVTGLWTSKNVHNFLHT